MVTNDVRPHISEGCQTKEQNGKIWATYTMKKNKGDLLHLLLHYTNYNAFHLWIITLLWESSAQWHKKLQPNQEIGSSHNFENLNKRKDFQKNKKRLNLRKRFQAMKKQVNNPEGIIKQREMSTHLAFGIDEPKEHHQTEV